MKNFSRHGDTCVGGADGSVCLARFAGVSCFRTLILCSLAVLPAAAQDDSWKKEIDNRLVRVSLRQLAPRETVSAAGLPPGLLVFVTDYSVRVTGAAGPEELQGMAGEVRWHSGGGITLENLSGQRLDVALVVPTFSPEPSFPLPPAGRRAIKFENDLVRARRFHVPAGAKTPERLGPAVVLQLAPAHIRFTYTDGHVDEARMKPGDFRFDVAGAFTFENLGDRLEVLKIDLKTSEQERK